jgi:hypothetical protein
MLLEDNKSLLAIISNFNNSVIDVEVKEKLLSLSAKFVKE